MGEIPLNEVWPELWVVNDDDFDMAVRILKEVNSALEVKIESWICHKCKEQVDEGFGECWNCGTLKQGGAEQDVGNNATSSSQN